MVHGFSCGARRSWLVAALASVLSACAAPSTMEWVQVDRAGRGFIGHDSGRPVIPWGFNYDHDERTRLLEDYWEAEWPKVVEDFREMKALGANVARVHLQFARFMEAPRSEERRVGKECRSRWSPYH